MKIQRTATALLVVLGMVTALPFLEESQKASIVEGVGSGDYPAPPNGDWLIETQPTVVENETIILNGSLLVRNGASLTLRNVTLKLNSPAGLHFRIEVESGSTLRIEGNSTITAVNPAYNWYLVANDGSSIDFVNSTFSHAGWEPGTNGVHSGVWISADGGTIANCTFIGNYYGLCLYQATDTLIANNTFTSNRNDGIYVWESNATNISSNSITNGSANGIHLDNSEETVIDDNNITNNTKCGIYVYYSGNTSVSDNKVIRNQLKGIEVRQSSNSTVLRNVVTGAKDYRQELGIYVSSDNCTVEDNELSNHSISGIFFKNSLNSFVKLNNVSSSLNVGIRLSNSINTTVDENNIIDSIDYGISIDQSEFCNVSHNFVTETVFESGLRLIDSNNCSISYNQIVFNKIGMVLTDAANCTISDNLVTNNLILAMKADSLRNCSIVENRIMNNEDGIESTGIEGCLITENSVMSNNQIGISLSNMTTDNILWSNHLGANGESNAKDDNGTNHWDNGSHGNWWYDYSGVDAGGDGLGDTPYLVPGAGLAQDKYPRFIPTAPDRMPPLIAYIAPLTFPEGYPGINITLRATEAAPATFTAYHNGNPWASGPWNGSEVVVLLQALPAGLHNFTLVLRDTSNNFATITVWMKVEATFPPWLTPAPDITLDEGSAGSHIDWQLGDSVPGNYSVYLNDTLVSEFNWSATSDLPVSISLRYSVDGLPDGVFSLRLAASNIVRLHASDMVQVLVVDTTPPEVQAKVTINRTSTALLSAAAENIVTIQLAGNAEAYWYNIEGVDTVNQTVDNPTFKILTKTITTMTSERTETNTTMTIERAKSLARTLPAGEYTLHVYGSDLAGNIGYTAVQFTLEPESSAEPSQPESSSEPSSETSSAVGRTTEPSTTAPSFSLIIAMLAILIILPVRKKLRKRNNASEI
jgi:parallel beta-helix repeat protein